VGENQQIYFLKNIEEGFSQGKIKKNFPSKMAFLKGSF